MNKKNHLSQAGATIVEFALTILIFLTIIFGIINFCLAIWMHVTMAEATREGARYGSILGGVANNTQLVVAKVQEKCIGVTPDDVTATWDFSGSTPTKVTVTASYVFHPIPPLGIFGDLNFTSTASMKVAN